MARDHRLTQDSGQRLLFTCGNKRYRTNIRKGNPHNPLSETLGSATQEPLVLQNDQYSLWLEHVVETKSGEECYWLMWYDNDGVPTIPMSGVFDRSELSNMVGQLAENSFRSR